MCPKGGRRWYNLTANRMLIASHDEGPWTGRPGSMKPPHPPDLNAHPTAAFIHTNPWSMLHDAGIELTPGSTLTFGFTGGLTSDRCLMGPSCARLHPGRTVSCTTLGVGRTKRAFNRRTSDPRFLIQEVS